MSKPTYEIEMADRAVRQYYMLKEALSLAITLPNDKDSLQAVEIAEDISSSFSPATIERAKAEVEAELNLNPEVQDDESKIN